MGIFKKGRPSRQDPPDQAGIYRLIDKLTGEIDYIGETGDLRSRRGQHFRSGDLPVSPDSHHFEWKTADDRSTSRTRREHEKIQIDRHQPPLNRRRGGGGRRSGR